MINKPLIIAIDGLSGVGKGTLARSLADRLGLPYLDTGILYRVVTRKMLDSGLKPDDADTIKIAENLDEKDWQRSDLRTPKVDRAVSQVAAQIPIRRALLDMQRRFAAKKGAVMDGRDIGTVIFPSAQVKLFILRVKIRLIKLNRILSRVTKRIRKELLRLYVRQKMQLFYRRISFLQKLFWRRH